MNGGPASMGLFSSPGHHHSVHSTQRMMMAEGRGLGSAAAAAAAAGLAHHYHDNHNQQQQHHHHQSSDRGSVEDDREPWQTGSNNSAEDEKALTPEEKLERSRVRNRDHSRKSRQRKKALVEGMKKQVTELGAYRMLVEQAYDLISAHTTDDRALFLYASGAFQRLLGINSQDLLGIQLVHMVHPDDVARVTEALRSALLYNQVTQVRYRFRHHARGEHTVETSFRMVPTRLLAVTRVNGPTFPSELARH